MKEKNSSRMPRTNCISIGEYIYGTKSKNVIQKKQATMKKTGKIITNTKVEMSDFEIIKTIICNIYLIIILTMKLRINTLTSRIKILVIMTLKKLCDNLPKYMILLKITMVC